MIIGSVFRSDGREKLWYELQMKFIKSTTKNYRHVVYVNGEYNDCFNSSEVIGVNPEHSEAGTENHSIGLKKIVEFFRNNPCDEYLLLDSDCFPVMFNWQQKITNRMLRYGKEFAAPIRFENLELFPHPCCIFVLGNAIMQDYFDGIFEITQTKNLLGKTITDNGCSLPLHQCYPLLKSNRYSPHPVFPIVYNDMFYHHVAGSRSQNLKAMANHYFDHLNLNYNIVKERSLDLLVDSPNEYISSLMNKRILFL
jgi:hypothetical protein